MCVGTGGGSHEPTHFFEKRELGAWQKRSSEFVLFTTFCAAGYSGEARKRGSPPADGKRSCGRRALPGVRTQGRQTQWQLRRRGGGSGRLRPHDWQPVRSTERVEGLQRIERCAGCGAGRTTLTAADTGEHRITWVDPDPLPGSCTGPGEGDRLICGSCGKAIPLGSHPPPPDTADQFCATSVVIRDYDQNANPPGHWFND